MGRAAVGQQRPIRLSPEEWRYVEHLAERLGLDRSRTIRRIVQDHMAASALMASKDRS